MSVLIQMVGTLIVYIRTFDFCGCLQYNNCRKRKENR